MQTNQQPEVIFPESTSQIIKGIAQKYTPENAGTEMLDKVITTIAYVLKKIAMKEISSAELISEIKNKTNLPQNQLQEIAKEIEAIVATARPADQMVSLQKNESQIKDEKNKERNYENFLEKPPQKTSEDSRKISKKDKLMPPKFKKKERKENGMDTYREIL